MMPSIVLALVGFSQHEHGLTLPSTQEHAKQSDHEGFAIGNALLGSGSAMRLPAEHPVRDLSRRREGASVLVC